MRWLMGSVLLLMVSRKDGLAHSWGMCVWSMTGVYVKILRLSRLVFVPSQLSLVGLRKLRFIDGNAIKNLNILVIQPSDKIEIIQQGMPIKDLLVLGKSYAYRTGSRKRITSLDFSKKVITKLKSTLCLA